MARWDPGARDRLRQAALDLYAERGFAAVTASDIAARAGLARRSFFRYFADTREVLFAGSEQLPAALAEAVRRGEPATAPLETALTALEWLGEQLVEHAIHPEVRRAIIAASPELQERERTKNAALTTALAVALAERGAEHTDLVASVAIAVFVTAFERWGEHGGHEDFSGVFTAAVDELRSTLG